MNTFYVLLYEKNKNIPINYFRYSFNENPEEFNKRINDVNKSEASIKCNRDYKIIKDETIIAIIDIALQKESVEKDQLDSVKDALKEVEQTLEWVGEYVNDKVSQIKSAVPNDC